MLNRNKTEGTQLDIRVNKFSENLKAAKLQMDIEKEKARKSKDKKFNVKIMLKDLKETLEQDANKQITHITTLESSIMNRKELIRRYDQRTKRQAEIIELAARHDRTTHERSIRDQITANKLLYDLVSEKELKFKEAGKEIESAFQDIKIKTGLTDPREMISKFMIKEETNARLINSVEKSEITLDELKKEYHALRDQLKNLILTTDRSKNTENGKEDEWITERYNKLGKVQDQHRKISVIYKEISKWAYTICKKLEIQSSDQFDISINRISDRVKALQKSAEGDKEEFERNLEQYTLKKTNDLIKEIYKEPNNSISQPKV